VPGQLAGKVRAAQKTNMNPIFKHLARRKTIDVKKICFLKDMCFCLWQYQFCLILISYEEGIRIFSKQAFVEYF
jgi:hypothetical protein